MLKLRASKAQKPKPRKEYAVLSNTENEKEKNTPSRIIQISQQKQLKKDRHTQSTKGMA